MSVEERTYYYYYRNKKREPVITVCLIVGKKGISRGISICSNLDFPCKKEGRKIARGYAKRAYHTKKTDTKTLVKSSKAYNVIFSTDSSEIYEISLFKSTYNPNLTDFEKKVLKI